MPPPERRASDSPRSYAALCDYFALGPGRSIDKLLQKYTSSVTGNPPTRMRGTLGKWSADHAWQDRIQAATDAEMAAEEAQRATIRAARRKELEDRDWESGNALHAAVSAILSELPRFIRGNVQTVERNGVQVEIHTLALKAGPGELARAMELASKLQRLSVGEATEHTRLTTKDGMPLFPDFERALEKTYADSDPPTTDSA